MRTLGFFAIVLLAFLQSALPADTGRGEADWNLVSVAAAQEEGREAPAARAPDVDIDIGGGETTTTWIVDPIFLVIGGAVLLLIIVLIAMASRGGGGTTIIRER
jgi:hypothetical protein